MKDRDLPEVVKATFGVGSPLRVKLLTSATLLRKQHSGCRPVFQSYAARHKAHSILRFASQNCHSKSRIPDPDPCHSGGLGQQ
jgi:hypothetical protein